MLGDSTGIHQAAVWGVAVCLSPFLHWRIENFQDNVKFVSGEKNIKVQLFAFLVTTNFGFMAAKSNLSFSAEEIWNLRGRDQGAAEMILQWRGGGHPMIHSSIKSKRKEEGLAKASKYSCSGENTW